MSRSRGRLGWGGGGGAGGVSSFNTRTGDVVPASGDYNAGQITETATKKIMTDTERTKLAGLTTVTDGYPYSQIYVPATSMFPNPSLAGDYPILQLINPGGAYNTVYAWRFSSNIADNIRSQVFFYVPFMESELNVVTPSFKVYPIWLQTSISTAPANKFVKWGCRINNVAVGSNTISGCTGAVYGVTSPVRDAYLRSGGDANANTAISVTTVQGDALSATNSNDLLFEISRDIGITDDFAGYAYLLGVQIQFKNNFTLVGEWNV